MTKTLDDAGLDLIFREARTYNGYTDRPVSEDTLRAIWDLAKMGPTSANQSPARIVWCVSDEAKAKLAGLSGGANPPKTRPNAITGVPPVAERGVWRRKKTGDKEGDAK